MSLNLWIYKVQRTWNRTVILVQFEKTYFHKQGWLSTVQLLVNRDRQLFLWTNVSFLKWTEFCVNYGGIQKNQQMMNEQFRSFRENKKTIVFKTNEKTILDRLRWFSFLVGSAKIFERTLENTIHLIIFFQANKKRERFLYWTNKNFK